MESKKVAYTKKLYPTRSRIGCLYASCGLQKKIIFYIPLDHLKKRFLCTTWQSSPCWSRCHRHSKLRVRRRSKVVDASNTFSITFEKERSHITSKLTTICLGFQYNQGGGHGTR
eukprot:scaffold630_cov350-Pavlova_lutheri.AAC.13